jgi:hypothetical protein
MGGCRAGFTGSVENFDGNFIFFVKKDGVIMMKKILAGILILTGAVLFAQETASIREISGTVEVRGPGDSGWRAARTGEQIGRDTMISTGFKSNALIALGNSTLLVRPLTRLSLEEIQNIAGEESVDLYLHTGRVRANVNPPASCKTDFTVHAPMATASVRGTSFDFDGTNLSVDEGRVHISGGDGSGTYVGAGHQAVSNPETGKTSGAGEQMKAALTPALPPAASAAAAEHILEPAVIIPTAANRDLGFQWN